MNVEATLYMLAAVLPEDAVPTIGPKGEPLFRYVSWLLCCPILIKVLLKMLSIDGKVDPNSINVLILLDIFMTCMGIFACMYTNRTVQMGFFMVGLASACIMVYKISKIFAQYEHTLPNSLERKIYMIFFFCMWAVFAILFLLGPPMYEIIGPDATVVSHVISDLLAKNLFCMMSWKLNRLPPGGKRKQVMDVISLNKDADADVEMQAKVFGNTRTSSQSNLNLDMDSLKEAMKEVMKDSQAPESTTQRAGISPEISPEFSVHGLRSLPNSQHNTPSATYRNIPVGLQGTPQGSPFNMNRTLNGGFSSSTRQLRQPGGFPGTPTGQTRSLQPFPQEQQQENAETMLMQQLAINNAMLIKPAQSNNSPDYHREREHVMANNGPVADRVNPRGRSRSASRERARDSPLQRGRSVRGYDSGKDSSHDHESNRKKSKKKRSEKKRRKSSTRKGSRDRRSSRERNRSRDRYEGGRTGDDYD